MSFAECQLGKTFWADGNIKYPSDLNNYNTYSQSFYNVNAEGEIVCDNSSSVNLPLVLMQGSNLPIESYQCHVVTQELRRGGLDVIWSFRADNDDEYARVELFTEGTLSRARMTIVINGVPNTATNRITGWHNSVLDVSCTAVFDENNIPTISVNTVGAGEDITISSTGIIPIYNLDNITFKSYVIDIIKNQRIVGENLPYTCTGLPYVYNPPKKIYFEDNNGSITSMGRFVVSDSYSSKLTLSMHKTTDSQRQVSWVDMGADTDRYETDFSIEVEDGLMFLEGMEERFKGYQGYTYIQIEDYDGFYPFTPIYKSNAQYGEINRMRMLLSETPKPEQVTIFNNVLHLNLKAYPAPFSDIVYHDEIIQCDNVPEDWNWDVLGDNLPLPYPEDMFSPALNAKRGALQTNGSAVADVPLYKTTGEVVTFSLDLTEEKMRLLINSLRSIRGDVFQCYFPENFNPFSHIYRDNNYFNVRLYNNAFTVRANGYKNMTIDISLQLVEVVS